MSMVQDEQLQQLGVQLSVIEVYLNSMKGSLSTFPPIVQVTKGTYLKELQQRVNEER